MAAFSESVGAEGVQAVHEAQSRATHNDLLVFERLISEIPATFVAVPADAVDARIKGAVGRVAEFLDVDRATRRQQHLICREQGRFRFSWGPWHLACRDVHGRKAGGIR